MIQDNVAHLYKITHVPTGQFYYGKRNGTTQRNYWGSGVRITNLINKYPRSEFEYKILVIGNVDYIFELEEKIVNKELLKDEKCLNLATGGKGTRFLSEEHRKKLPELFSKRKKSEFSKKKVSESLREYYKTHQQIMTPEKIAKMKETKAKNPTGTGKWMNDDNVQTKIKHENVNKYIEMGWKMGTLKKHITVEYREKLKIASINQWKKQKGEQCL